MNFDLLPGATSSVTPNLARFLARLDRPSLEAVAQAAIDRLDEIDGDPDDEESDEDCCAAHDDVAASLALHLEGPHWPGDPDDAEREEPDYGFWGINQAAPISIDNPAI